jgi:uncharacterized protein (DUF342 family)
MQDCDSVGSWQPEIMWLPDGGIDFTALAPEQNIKAGERIAILGGAELLIGGKNIRSEIVSEGIELTSRANGILRFDGSQYHVRDLLIVHGNVESARANIACSGDVYIGGSIERSFSVKTDGDVFVAGDVMAGAQVVAKGNLVVGGEIVGRDTKATVFGSVKVKNIRETSVHCLKNLEVGNSIFHGSIRCGGEIFVRPGQGDRSGLIAGGEGWGCRGITSRQVGDQSAVSTALTLGVDPKSADRLAKLKDEIDQLNQHILKQLCYFDLDSVNVKAIRQKIEKAAGPRKTILAHAAKNIGELVQTTQKLIAERATAERPVKQILENATIEVSDSVFPGVVLQLGSARLEVKEPKSQVVFSVEEDEIVESDPKL